MIRPPFAAPGPRRRPTALQHPEVSAAPSPSRPDPFDVRRADGLVHFAGDWEAGDEVVVARTITRIEERPLLPRADRSLGEPWVCTCQSVHDGHFFAAHRAGSSHVTTARTARGLILRLYTWASGLRNG